MKGGRDLHERQTCPQVVNMRPTGWSSVRRRVNYGPTSVEAAPRFSFTMPSEAAKNASTVEMKWRSLSLSFCSQSFMSWQRSISSAVQNEASALLVHGPDVGVFDGEEHEAVRVLHEQRLAA